MTTGVERRLTALEGQHQQRADDNSLLVGIEAVDGSVTVGGQVMTAAEWLGMTAGHKIIITRRKDGV